MVIIGELADAVISLLSQVMSDRAIAAQERRVGWLADRGPSKSTSINFGAFSGTPDNLHHILTPLSSSRPKEAMNPSGGERVRKTKFPLEEPVGDGDEPERKVSRRGPGTPCASEGCTRAARGVGPNGSFCKRHGGGKRCAHAECTTSAEGKSTFCIKHGGGRRCEEVGCTKAAQGKTTKCCRHGGGTRCTQAECEHPSFGIFFFFF